MARYDIRHTKSSEADLTDILRYIAIELEMPETALRMIETIDNSIESLFTMPHRYPLVDDAHLASMGYRKMVVKNYIAFFTVDDDEKIVNVERILYARRDWLNIL